MPVLRLVVGVFDHPWRELRPTDGRVYELFLGAHRFQRGWSAAEHAWFFESTLAQWPLRRGKRTNAGLVAEHAARWLSAGFTRAEVERALGEADLPRDLWRLADDARDWLASRPHAQRAGIGGTCVLENALAGEHERRGDLPRAAAAREHFRRTQRTPRVITADEAAASPFAQPPGHPEHISESVLRDIVPGRAAVLDRIAAADAALWSTGTVAAGSCATCGETLPAGVRGSCPACLALRRARTADLPLVIDPLAADVAVPPASTTIRVMDALHRMYGLRPPAVEPRAAASGGPERPGGE